VSGWKVVGHGRPWMAACELAESSLVEQREKAMGWGWSSRVWRCLPREELNQGGLVGEIKRSTKSLWLCSWRKQRSEEEGEQDGFGELGMAMEGGLGCLL